MPETTQTTQGEDFFGTGNELCGVRIDTYGTGIGVTAWNKEQDERASVLLTGTDGRKLSEWLGSFYARNPRRLEP